MYVPRSDVSEAVHSRISVCLASPTSALSYDDLARWLDNLAGVLGERLLRLKGLVGVMEYEQPILVQSVGTLFAAPRPFGLPGAAASPFLVIIARDLQFAELGAISPIGAFKFSGDGANRSLSLMHSTA